MKSYKPYSAEEDVKIVKFITSKQSYIDAARGNSVWEMLESLEILPHRSYHSMRNRFLRTIVPKINKYEHLCRKVVMPNWITGLKSPTIPHFFKKIESVVQDSVCSSSSSVDIFEDEVVQAPAKKVQLTYKPLEVDKDGWIDLDVDNQEKEAEPQATSHGQAKEQTHDEQPQPSKVWESKIQKFVKKVTPGKDLTTPPNMHADKSPLAENNQVESHVEAVKRTILSSPEKIPEEIVAQKNPTTSGLDTKGRKRVKKATKLPYKQCRKLMRENVSVERILNLQKLANQLAVRTKKKEAQHKKIVNLVNQVFHCNELIENDSLEERMAILNKFKEQLAKI